MIEQKVVKMIFMNVQTQGSIKRKRAKIEI